MTNEERINEVLAAHPHWRFERKDRFDTLYFKTNECPRCSGTGRLKEYGYVNGGVCFKCNGRGFTENERTITVATPEHLADLNKKREERALAKVVATYPDRMKRAGFGMEEGIYVVYRVRGETFSKKDQLKELGCRFNRQLNWFSPKDLAEEGFPCQRFTADEVLEENCYPLITWRNVSEVKGLYDDKPVAAGEYVGEIGEKLQKKLYVTAVKPVDTPFGLQFMNTFEDEDGNFYRWFTKKELDEGLWHDYIFTVKEHNEFGGKKFTKIIRCKEV